LIHKENETMPQGLLIHTIGHSDHDTANLVALLRRHGITHVIDVRSQPYSRWAHQFNREILASDLQEAGIAYTFMGDSLGGRPSDPALYNPGEDRPDYQRMEQTTDYQSGIEDMLELAQADRIALMCGEGDHRHCHRHLLITQTLLERHVGVRHIQPDGTAVEGEQIPRQLSLFG
jgi:uncharacterized protein (DUF488 family)